MILLTPGTKPIDWIAFDVEIATDLMPENLELLPFSEQKKAKGEAFSRMMKGEGGMSVAVTWDTRSEEYDLFDGHTVHELFAKLEEFPVVAAYNHQFDVNVVQGIVGRPLSVQHVIDPLSWIFDVTHKRELGTKLGQIADWTLGIGKIEEGSGRDAYELFATGQIAKLVRYCRRDVFLLRELVRHARDHGYFHGPRGRIELVLPDWVKDLA